MNKDVEVGQSPADTTSQLAFSPTAEFLAASSWDGQMRIWEVSPTGQTAAKCAISMPNHVPMLTCAWSLDGTKLFGAGAVAQGQLADLNSLSTAPNGQAFAQHDAPITQSMFCPASAPAQMHGMLATASLDKTVKFWDARQSPTVPVATLSMPERVYSIDMFGSLMVVATAERHILVYNLNNPTVVYKQITSPLKHQTRVVRCFTTLSNLGYAVGSIEGRVAIQYVEDKDQSNNFSFKCHRSNNDVYAINAISFHPTYGTFSTAGADGAIFFWDKDSKQRLKTFAPTLPLPIVSTAFNRTGGIFAYATGYDWSKGSEHATQEGKSKEKIYLHPVKDEDIKPKAKKR